MHVVERQDLLEAWFLEHVLRQDLLQKLVLQLAEVLVQELQQVQELVQVWIQLLPLQVLLLKQKRFRLHQHQTRCKQHRPVGYLLLPR